MDLNFSGLSMGSSKSQLETKGPYPVVILGGGPAGFAAALYAARAELHPLLLTGMQIGGQAAITHTIENYPGFPEGVGGPELSDKFREQAERFGTVVEYDTAVDVDLSQRPFRITGYNAEYLAETLIIATGATPRKLDIPGEEHFTGRGVSYCATCDGWFFKDKNVFVVGGGDSALEEGLFLTRYANEVTIVHRRDEFRAGAILQSRARSNPKMRFMLNTVIDAIQGNGEVQTAQMRNVQTGEVVEKSIDGIFIFIGHTPNTQLFEGQLEMKDGYIVTNNRMETSIPGVYAAGEAADSVFRQVITSAGMGAAAAIMANKFLEEHESERAHA